MFYVFNQTVFHLKNCPLSGTPKTFVLRVPGEDLVLWNILSRCENAFFPIEKCTFSDRNTLLFQPKQVRFSVETNAFLHYRQSFCLNNGQPHFLDVKRLFLSNTPPFMSLRRAMSKLVKRTHRPAKAKAQCSLFVTMTKTLQASNLTVLFFVCYTLRPAALSASSKRRQLSAPAPRIIIMLFMINTY